MAIRLFRDGLLVGFLVLLVGTSSLARTESETRDQSYLTPYDPVLVKMAEQSGLYDRSAYPVFRGMNPYYIRGDFNGDGESDVAFWLTEQSSGLRGVGILHSTLDTLYIFGAGKPRPPGHSSPEMRQVWVDAWHLLAPRQVDNHPYGTIPEIGLVEGEPFTFERETLEFIHLGKSAFVFYWAKGKYWEFWTAD